MKHGGMENTSPWRSVGPALPFRATAPQGGRCLEAPVGAGCSGAAGCSATGAAAPFQGDGRAAETPAASSSALRIPPLAKATQELPALLRRRSGKRNASPQLPQRCSATEPGPPPLRPFTRAMLLCPLRHSSLPAAATAACAGLTRLPAPSQGAALSVRNPSARGHVYQPRKAARPAPHRCRCAPGLPCSLFLRPWLLLRLAQPWAPLPALPGPACPPYPRWWPGISVSSGRCSG